MPSNFGANLAKSFTQNVLGGIIENSSSGLYSALKSNGGDLNMTLKSMSATDKASLKEMLMNDPLVARSMKEAGEALGMPKQLLGNFLEDIKNGNWFGNAEREDEALNNMSGNKEALEALDAMDNMDFGDDGFGDEEFGDMDNTSSDSSSFNYESSDGSSELSLTKTTNIADRRKSFKTTINAVDPSFLASVTDKMVGSVEQSTAQIAQLNSFHEDKTNNFYDRSIEFYEHTTEILDNMNSTFNSLYKKEVVESGGSILDKLFGSGGFLNIKEFLSTMNPASRLRSMFEEGGEFDIYKGMVQGMIANPMKMITDQILDELTPKIIKSQIEDLSKSLLEVPKRLVFQLHDAAFSRTAGPLQQFLGSIFGFSLGMGLSRKGSFTKGPIPFDGVTKKAITDVIPTYLRKILNNIVGIARHLHASRFVDEDQEIKYDYEKGEFSTLRKIKKEREEKDFETARSEFSDVISARSDQIREAGGIRLFANDKQRSKLHELDEAKKKAEKEYNIIDRQYIKEKNGLSKIEKDIKDKKERLSFYEDLNNIDKFKKQLEDSKNEKAEIERQLKENKEKPKDEQLSSDDLANLRYSLNSLVSSIEKQENKITRLTEFSKNHTKEETTSMVKDLGNEIKALKTEYEKKDLEIEQTTGSVRTQAKTSLDSATDKVNRYESDVRQDIDKHLVKGMTLISNYQAKNRNMVTLDKMDLSDMARIAVDNKMEFADVVDYIMPILNDPLIRAKFDLNNPAYRERLEKLQIEREKSVTGDVHYDDPINGDHIHMTDKEYDEAVRNKLENLSHTDKQAAQKFYNALNNAATLTGGNKFADLAAKRKKTKYDYINLKGNWTEEEAFKKSNRNLYDLLFDRNGYQRNKFDVIHEISEAEHIKQTDSELYSALFDEKNGLRDLKNLIIEKEEDTGEKDKDGKAITKKVKSLPKEIREKIRRNLMIEKGLLIEDPNYAGNYIKNPDVLDYKMEDQTKEIDSMLDGSLISKVESYFETKKKEQEEAEEKKKKGETVEQKHYYDMNEDERKKLIRKLRNDANYDIQTKDKQKEIDENIKKTIQGLTSEVASSHEYNEKRFEEEAKKLYPDKKIEDLTEVEKAKIRSGFLRKRRTKQQAFEENVNSTKLKSFDEILGEGNHKPLDYIKASFEYASSRIKYAFDKSMTFVGKGIEKFQKGISKLVFNNEKGVATNLWEDIQEKFFSKSNPLYEYLPKSWTEKWEKRKEDRDKKKIELASQQLLAQESISKLTKDTANLLADSNKTQEEMAHEIAKLVYQGVEHPHSIYTANVHLEELMADLVEACTGKKVDRKKMRNSPEGGVITNTDTKEDSIFKTLINNFDHNDDETFDKNALKLEEYAKANNAVLDKDGNITMDTMKAAFKDQIMASSKLTEKEYNELYEAKDENGFSLMAGVLSDLNNRIKELNDPDKDLNYFEKKYKGFKRWLVGDGGLLTKEGKILDEDSDLSLILREKLSRKINPFMNKITRKIKKFISGDESILDENGKEISLMDSVNRRFKKISGYFKKHLMGDNEEAFKDDKNLIDFLRTRFELGMLIPFKSMLIGKDEGKLLDKKGNVIDEDSSFYQIIKSKFNKITLGFKEKLVGEDTDKMKKEDDFFTVLFKRFEISVLDPAKDFLLGTKDEKGNRPLPKFLKENEKQLKRMGIGGVAGAGALGLLFGHPLIGAGIGMFVSSNKFQEEIFGDNKDSVKSIIRRKLIGENKKGVFNYDDSFLTVVRKRLVESIYNPIKTSVKNLLFGNKDRDGLVTVIGQKFADYLAENNLITRVRNIFDSYFKFAKYQLKKVFDTVTDFIIQGFTKVFNKGMQVVSFLFNKLTDIKVGGNGKTLGEKISGFIGRGINSFVSVNEKIAGRMDKTRRKEFLDENGEFDYKKAMDSDNRDLAYKELKNKYFDTEKNDFDLDKVKDDGKFDLYKQYMASELAKEAKQNNILNIFDKRKLKTQKEYFKYLKEAEKHPERFIFEGGEFRYTKEWQEKIKNGEVDEKDSIANLAGDEGFIMKVVNKVSEGNDKIVDGLKENAIIIADKIDDALKKIADNNNQLALARLQQTAKPEDWDDINNLSERGYSLSEIARMDSEQRRDKINELDYSNLFAEGFEDNIVERDPFIKENKEVNWKANNEYKANLQMILNKRSDFGDPTVLAGMSKEDVNILADVLKRGYGSSLFKNNKAKNSLFRKDLQVLSKAGVKLHELADQSPEDIHILAEVARKEGIKIGRNDRNIHGLIDNNSSVGDAKKSLTITKQLQQNKNLQKLIDAGYSEEEARKINKNDKERRRALKLAKSKKKSVLADAKSKTGEEVKIEQEEKKEKEETKSYLKRQLEKSEEIAANTGPIAYFKGIGSKIISVIMMVVGTLSTTYKFFKNSIGKMFTFFDWMKAFKIKEYGESVKEKALDIYDSIDEKTDGELSKQKEKLKRQTRKARIKAKRAKGKAIRKVKASPKMLKDASSKTAKLAGKGLKGTAKLYGKAALAPYKLAGKATVKGAKVVGAGAKIAGKGALKVAGKLGLSGILGAVGAGFSMYDDYQEGKNAGHSGTQLLADTLIGQTSDTVGGMFMNAGSQALKWAGVGAAIGSVFPGPGTIIGGVTGGLLGAVAGFFGSDPTKAFNNLTKSVTNAGDFLSETIDSIADVVPKAFESLLDGVTDAILFPVNALCDWLDGKDVTSSEYLNSQSGLFGAVSGFIEAVGGAVKKVAISLLTLPFKLAEKLFIDLPYKIISKFAKTFDRVLSHVINTDPLDGPISKLTDWIKDKIDKIVYAVKHPLETGAKLIFGGGDDEENKEKAEKAQQLAQSATQQATELLTKKGYSTDTETKKDESGVVHAAGGNYFEANNPQIAVVGDNKNEGEIVSPESKMYDITKSAITDSMPNSNDNGNYIVGQEKDGLIWNGSKWIGKGSLKYGQTVGGNLVWNGSEFESKSAFDTKNNQRQWMEKVFLGTTSDDAKDPVALMTKRAKEKPKKDDENKGKYGIYGATDDTSKGVLGGLFKKLFGDDDEGSDKKPNRSGGGNPFVGGTGDNKKDIWGHLTSNGFTKEGAAGILACWQEESGCDPTKMEGEYIPSLKAMKQAALASNEGLDAYTQKLFAIYANDGLKITKSAYQASDGHYYPGIGLAQWTGERGKNLFDYAKSKNKSWGDLGVQLEFFKKELDENYTSVEDALKGAKTAEDATRIFAKDYEKVQRDDFIQNRVNISGSIYNELKDYVPPSSNGSLPAAGGSTQDYMTLNGTLPITSGYGDRTNPITGAHEYHAGIDIAYATNQEVPSPVNGTITDLGSGDGGGYGHYVEVTDANGMHHMIAHNNKNDFFSVGDTVSQGDTVALAGSTGMSTGTHVHYGIEPAPANFASGARDYINPANYATLAQGGIIGMNNELKDKSSFKTDNENNIIADTKNGIDVLVAQGGFFKKNSPTTLVRNGQPITVGDNTSEGEIVAPESKMYNIAKQAVNDSLLGATTKFDESVSSKTKGYSATDTSYIDNAKTTLDTSNEIKKVDDIIKETTDKTVKDSKTNKSQFGKDLAPNGRRYEENDIKYLMKQGYDREQALEILSKEEKYTKKKDRSFFGRIFNTAKDIFRRAKNTITGYTRDKVIGTIKDKINGDKPELADEKAPNGKNYEENDIKYLMSQPYISTREQAIELLSKEEKYTKKEEKKNSWLENFIDSIFGTSKKEDKKSDKIEYADEKAPNGKNYEENDIRYLMSQPWVTSREQAIEFLSKNSKYAKQEIANEKDSLLADAKNKLKPISEIPDYNRIKPEDDDFVRNAKIEWQKKNGYETEDGSSSATVNSTGYQNAAKQVTETVINKNENGGKSSSEFQPLIDLLEQIAGNTAATADNTSEQPEITVNTTNSEVTNNNETTNNNNNTTNNTTNSTEKKNVFNSSGLPNMSNGSSNLFKYNLKLKPSTILIAQGK